MNAIHLRYETGVLFILGAIALISVSACTRPKDKTIQVRFSAAPGVREEASVRYLGVDVGKVDRISLEGPGVLHTLRLQRSDVAIHRGDRFEIVPAGLLGDHVIDIKPEPSSALVSDPREILQGQDLKTRIVSVRLAPEEVDVDTLLSALNEVLYASPQDKERVAEKWRNWLKGNPRRMGKGQDTGP